MGFLTDLLKEKRDAELRWTKEHDDSHTWSDWVAFICRFVTEGMFEHPVRFKSALVRGAGVAWSAYESTTRQQTIVDVEVFAATVEGKIWGFGTSRALAIGEFVRQADERWGDDGYRLSLYRTKRARAEDFIHFDRMFEDALDSYRQWHDEGDADPIWANGGTEKSGELEQLLGEVIEGYYRSRGGKWSHKHIPTGEPFAIATVTMDNGQWSEDDEPS